MKGRFKASATKAPMATPPVATPAITSVLGKDSRMVAANASRMNAHTSGYDRVLRLSQ